MISTSTTALQCIEIYGMHASRAAWKTMQQEAIYLIAFF